MGHVEPDTDRSLVGRIILQGTVQLPDVTRLGQSGEHALVREGLEGVLLLVVQVVTRRLTQVRKELQKDLLPSGQLLQAPSSLDPRSYDFPRSSQRGHWTISGDAGDSDDFSPSASSATSSVATLPTGAEVVRRGTTSSDGALVARCGVTCSDAVVVVRCGATCSAGALA